MANKYLNRKRKGDFVSPPSTSKPKLSYQINYNELGALCFATKHIPERTPKRWDLISSLVSDSSLAHKENKSISVILKEDESSCDHKLRQFDRTSSDCKEVVKLLYSRFKDFSESL